MKRSVELINVSKKYNDTTVVDNLNLSVRDGEFLTLLGPSGSGKSTILLMLAGFENPTAGEIRINGAVVNQLPPAKREIGMVFQNYALFPHMNINENVAFPLKVRGLNKSEIQDRVAAMLETVRLKDLGNRYPHQISGGQQQRVALARALVFSPRLVLMDEPLGALDKNLRDQMKFEIKRLHDELGVTMIYVTHDQSEALTMSDRIVIFDQGKIQQVDTPKNIYEAPQNVFVARFIGESNLIDGTVVDISDDCLQIDIGADTVITAGCDKPHDIGNRVSVSIRPESIHLNTAQDAANRITGTIRDIVYLGSLFQVHVTLTGGTVMQVSTSDKSIMAGLDQGDKVTVVWQANDTVVIS